MLVKPEFHSQRLPDYYLVTNHDYYIIYRQTRSKFCSVHIVGILDSLYASYDNIDEDYPE